MIGFDFALSIGVNLLEFDVVLTNDEIPDIAHNHRVHASTFRRSNGQFALDEPKIGDLTFAEIRNFDIGRIDVNSPYGKRFPDQAQLENIRVPKLSDLFYLVLQRECQNAHLMLDLRSDPDYSTEFAKRRRLVAVMVEKIRSANLETRTLLHSFDWKLLEECQRQAPEMPTPFLTQLPSSPDEVGEDSSKSVAPNFKGRIDKISDLVHEAGGSLWCPNVRDITAQGIQRAKELGLCVVVWTVNEPNDIEAMIKLRVDAIVSDYPGRVQQKLVNCGMEWI